MPMSNETGFGFKVNSMFGIEQEIADRKFQKALKNKEGKLQNPTRKLLKSIPLWKGVPKEKDPIVRKKMMISIQVLFFRIYFVYLISSWLLRFKFGGQKLVIPWVLEKNHSENRLHFGLTKLGTISENKMVQSLMLWKKI